ncbi:MAG TPA: hypothetical protein PLC04_01175 [Candidatus Kapabacteria bacterium]|jgi:hypothetical protein|nr:hypothetical protein [Candidatus Kapabacteria bacterium]HOV91677.1 hypothetical protein [Candidatus Kapabacteria bacterium]
MKKILALGFLLIFISCNSFETKPQRIEYFCVLQKSQFFSEVPNVIQNGGFVIFNLDENRNHIVAISDTSINGEQVQLNLSISYDTTNRHYFITPSARFTKDSATRIEYYTKTHINKHFKVKFQNVMNHLEGFCKGNYFPNRP